MNPAELIQELTTSQLDDMVSDFDRLRHSRPSQALRGRKYQGVRRVLEQARTAAAKREQARAHFMNGVAAAFYGLARLAEARELEEKLGPRLGLSDPADMNRDAESTSEEGSSGKDRAMLDIQKQFRFQDLVGFLEEDGIHFTSREEDGAIMAGFNGDQYGPIQLIGRSARRGASCS